jgi:transcriptional regulator with XRE-family HTH domain
MDVLSEFSERLSELMIIRNIKSEQLGKEIKASGSIVRCWLRGEKQISLPNLFRLADYFGCTIDFLAGRSDTELAFAVQTPPPFPEALRKVMAERGYTRYSLHKNTKFKDAYMYKWDHGSQPDLFTLVELADLFDVTIDYLVGREN